MVTENGRLSARWWVLVCSITLVAVGLVVVASTASTSEEYHLYRQGSLYKGENPAQAVSLTFDRGIEVQPARLKEQGRRWDLTLLEYGPDGDLQPAGTAERVVDQNRIDFVYSALVERYVNAAHGIEHVLTVPAPMASPQATLAFEFALAASDGVKWVARGDGRGVDLILSQADAMQYSDLAATDAQGKELAVRLEPIGDRTGLRIVVQTAEAAFPVTVGALVTTLPVAAPSGGNTGAFLPPPNDECSGAEVIPAAGPFPYLTTVTADVTDATTTGDPVAIPSCSFNNQPVARSVWYRFTPSASGTYGITTCRNAASGNTLPDTVLGVYTAAGSCTAPYAEVACNDDDSTCTGFTLHSRVSANLVAGTTYYILVWQWNPTGPPPVGSTSVQLQVTFTPPTTNDSCGTATPLTLNIPMTGTTSGAANDYQLNVPTCFKGFVHVTSTAPGRDVVYTFTAPSVDTYSFKVTHYAPTTGNAVLYLTDICPTGPPPIIIDQEPPCLLAANRSTARAEEIICMPMQAGQTVFAYVDDHSSTGAGGPFFIEVNRCVRETEPNDLPPQANALTCGIEGGVDPANDANFFALGTVAEGNRIFAFADGVAGNSAASDFKMHITTATDTLEFDDDDGDTTFGSLTPTVAGTKGVGEPTFIRMAHFSSTTRAEPYRLYSVVQPPQAAATVETEPNDTIATANSAANNYFFGELPGPRPSTDRDVYAFGMNAGDLVYVGLDADPDYDATVMNAALELLDSGGNILVRVNDGRTTGTVRARVPGNLSSNVPVSPSEALTYRAAVGGTYYVRVLPGSTTTTATSGNYLLSISVGCRSGSLCEGVVCDDLDPCTVDSCDPTTGRCRFEPLCDDDNPCTDDSCNGGVCTNTPNTLPCDDGSACTQNDVCSGGACQGTPVNCDDANACTTDSCIPATGCQNVPIVCNDNNVCTDDLCDVLAGCQFPPNTAPCTDNNACTDGDRCQGGACIPGPPLDCDDGNVCSDDSCDPIRGCLHIPNTAPCDDGDACTVGDQCGPSPGVPCDLAENFDGVTAPDLPAGWTQTVVIGNPAVDHWRTVTTQSDTPPNSAFTIDPSTVTDKVLDSPPLAIAAGIAQLRFRNLYNLEASTTPTLGYDGGVLEISINGSPFQDIIAAGGSFVAGGYTRTISSSFSSPIMNRMAWSGLSGLPGTTGTPIWIDSIVDLPASASNGTVVLRWRVATDSSVSRVGQWIDTVVLTGGRCPFHVCLPGPPADCNDSDLCTTDSCNPATGCVNTPVSCDDGNPCTDDSCDPSTGQCRSVTRNCDDGNPCTNDSCDTATGQCLNELRSCDDGDPCTNDSCDTATGQCRNELRSCDDGDPCTNDSCDTATGQCLNVPRSCDDQNACTDDSCDLSTGACVNASITCDDGNVCTDNTCDPATGCVYVPNTAPCDDGNVCTVGDRCGGGTCNPGGPLNCNDGNSCTNDSCDPAVGCVYTPNNTCGGAPRTQGYWKRLCRGPHPSGDFYTAVDVDCVNDACTFASVQSAADICARMHPNPSNDKCKQAEAQFMALSLNLCRFRVVAGQPIDSRCTTNTTVGQSYADADGILCNPARTHATCVRAQCESEEINSGEALWTNSLRIARLANGSVRLTWSAPYATPDYEAPRRYRVWRRATSESAWTLVHETSQFSFTDPAPGTWQYELTAVW